jgi:hypothetical protein
MTQFQIGDIVVGNNSWLNGLLGYGAEPGVIIHVGRFSSIIHLYILNEDIVLLNEYIDKISMSDEKQKLKIGDLVELKPEIKNIIIIRGAGIIIDATVIRTSDFDKKWKEDEISAFLVYFPEEEYEYTIPIGCLQLFSKQD